MLAIHVDDLAVLRRAYQHKTASAGEEIRLAAEGARVVQCEHLRRSLGQLLELQRAGDNDEQSRRIATRIEQHLAGAHVSTLSDRVQPRHLRSRQPRRELWPLEVTKCWARRGSRAPRSRVHGYCRHVSIFNDSTGAGTPPNGGVATLRFISRAAPCIIL